MVKRSFAACCEKDRKKKKKKHSNEYWSVFTFIQLRSVFASVRLVGVIDEFWNEFPIRHAVFYV